MSLRAVGFHLGAAGLLLLGGCGSDIVEPPPVSSAIVIDSVQLSLTPDSTGQAAGRYTFRVLGTAPAIEPDDIIVGAQDGGFLRRVVSVSSIGGEIEVQTTAAALAEAVQDGTLLDSVALTLDQAGQLRGSGDIRWGATVFEPLAAPILVRNGEIVLDGAQLAALPGGLDLVISQGRIRFDPTVRLEVEIRKFAVRKVDASATGVLTFDADLALTSQATVVDVSGETALFTLRKPFLSTIGGLPVAGEVALTFTAVWSVGAGGIIEAGSGFRSSGAVTVGARYLKTASPAWSLVKETSVSFAPQPLTFSAALDVYGRVGAKAELRLTLYRVAGPYLYAQGAARAGRSVDLLAGQVHDRCTADVEGGVGFDAKILDFALVEFEKSETFWSTTFCSSDTPIDGEPAALAFSFQPADVPVERRVFPAGFAIYPAVEAAVRDAEGGPLESFSAPVILSLSGNPCAGVLDGGGPVAPANATATFPALRIDRPCAGYVLRASAEGAASATSAPFDVGIPGDLNLDGWVGAPDTATLKLDVGRTDRPPADINKNGSVDVQDISILLSHWTVATGSADSVTGSSAILEANASPNWSPTSVWFEWGTDPGLATFASTSPQSIGSGPTSEAFAAPLAGLAANTIYYYRAVSSGGFGTRRGDVVSFTTTDGPGGGWISVSAGSAHACGIRDGGTAYCWGDNNVGELGTGAADVLAHPVPLAVSGGLRFQQVTAGAGHSCGRTDGAAYCWGHNSHGKLGNPGVSVSGSPFPVPVTGGFTFAALSAGDDHTCGLTPSGEAYCWGNNIDGQLGIGFADLQGHPAPEPVAGGHMFTSISSGRHYTCAVATDGVAYCWGANAQGQVGDGSTTARSAPTPVAPGLSFATVSAGSRHTCGVTTGQQAYCWGDNAVGELGNSTTVPSETPVAVAGGHVFVALGAGMDAAGNTPHACGLDIGHAAYCWGSNSAGQLGIGTADGSVHADPEPVLGGNLFTELSVRDDFACGVTADGAAYCWGNGDAGQLGNGAAGDRHVPTGVVDPQ